jgi:PDZ domain
MRRFFSILMIATLCTMSARHSSAQNQAGPEIRPNAAPQSPPTQAQPTQAQPAHTRTRSALLGVHVAPNPPRSQASPPGGVDPQQGVVVQRVTPGSPAERAGIKAGDTLTAFDDQKLVAAQQLVQLVRAEQPQQQVTIELLRDGKPQRLQVTLGEAPVGPSEMLPQPGPMGRPFGPGMGPMTSPWHLQQELSSVWQNFDSLSVKKTDEGKFHVEVQYLEKDAKSSKSELKKYAFDGTPEDIHRAIEETKELTLPQRFQLHRMVQFPGLEGGRRFSNVRPGSGPLNAPNPGLDETPPK